MAWIQQILVSNFLSAGPIDDINISDTFSSKTSYNNGYLSVDDVQEIQDSIGTLYAAIKHENGVSFVPYNVNEEVINFSKEDFKFGSAVFDDDDNIYILWAKSISDDDIEKALEEEYANVVVVKYDKSGNVITEYGFPVNLMGTQFPYDGGNAHLGWKNNVLLVYFHTEWTKDSLDGLHHQGSVAAAVDTETSKIIYSNDWQGSHAFGSCMIPTDYGYAAIQMGDATARGINFNSYYLNSPEEFKASYISGNGYSSLYHSSGQYGTNGNHSDGNITYTHMGGLAKSNTTYAIAGKSERVYTSDIYSSSGLQTGNYDVFIKLCDQTLLNNVSGLAGESRIDEATGEIADRNVVWLTECNETEKAGQVKIVTLEDGSYCVLWEKFVNGGFDSIRYVIIDECGNIIRRETPVINARLSDTSFQPVVDGDTLKWAVGNSSNNSLIWYTINLNEFTTDKDVYVSLEKFAEEKNIELILEAGCYGSFSNNMYWAYMKESGTLLIAGNGDMNFLEEIPWSQYANSITNIIIDNNITSVADNAFSDCKLITTITLPDSLTKLGEGAFKNCIALEIIQIPNGVTVINDDAFSRCESLKEVNLPDTLESIGNNAFYCCSSLEIKKLPESLDNIGDYAFYSCNNIELYEIPKNVVNIGVYAFDGCTGLKEITINEKVENIGEKAFCFCSNLKKVTINSLNAVIGDMAVGYMYTVPSGEKIKVNGFTLYVAPNSTAKTYAQENEIEFVEISSVTTTTTKPATNTTTTTTTETTTTTTEPTTTSTTTTTSDINLELQIGDVNDDDKITPVDASLVLMAYAKKQTQSDSNAGFEGLTSSQVAAADVNKDGRITPVDASIMLGYYSYCQTVVDLENLMTIEQFIEYKH